MTLSPDGKVRKAKALSGKIPVLKDAAEKTVKKWEFEPYLVNGTPVPVRTEMTLNFNNTLDHYRDPNGDAPVHLDELSAKALIGKSVQPQYPPDARLAHIQGAVELLVIVGEDGRVHALHIIKGHPMLTGPLTMRCANGNSSRMLRTAKLFLWIQRRPSRLAFDDLVLAGVYTDKQIVNFAHDFFVALRCIASRASQKAGLLGAAARGPAAQGRLDPVV